MKTPATLKAFLLCCCLLIHLRSNSQMAPLRPLVVRLDSGQTLRRPLIGLDTAYYRAVRLKVARAELLETGRALDAQQAAQLQAELWRCRGQVAGANQDFEALATVNKRLASLPIARPLLLDGHTYKGAAAGVAALLLLKFFFHL